MSAKSFVFTSLLALASGLPAVERSTLTQRTAECSQSNPGTIFYSCANGYVGCFAQDPCSLPPKTSSPTTTPCPTATPSPTATPTPSKPKEITIPRSYNIHPLDEFRRDQEDKVSHVDLSKPAGSRPTTTNALVFDNVPAGAKDCRLNWRSIKPDVDHQFKVDGNGVAFTRQLNGFPSQNEKVTFNSLKKYQDPAAQWNPSLDFNNWPGSEGDHLGPLVKCAEQVAVEIKGSDEGEGENRVFMSLTEKTGFYLTYEI